MSHKENMAELHKQLEKWRSHNEVHAKPADELLYKFLKRLLNLADPNEEEPTKEEPIQPVAPLASTNDEDTGDSGPGGNNPPPPNIP